MRAIPSAELTRILEGTGRWIFRAEVKRPQDAVWVDLTPPGSDRVVKVSPKIPEPDTPVLSFQVDLVPVVGGVSAAPGISGSALNQDTTAAYAPLLYPGNAIRVDAANLAAGETRDDAVWRRWLEGEIDRSAWPGNTVSLACTSLDGIIHEARIEDEEKRGAEDPGTPVETEIQGLLDRWLGGVTLRVVGTPDFGIGPYKPAEGSLGDQIRALAQRRGWDVRYLWHDDTQSFQYTLYLPPRDKTTPDLVLEPRHVRDVPGLEVDRKYVRNRFVIDYPDTDTGRRERRVRENAASIARFRKRPMKIVQADDDVSITTAAQADLLNLYADQDLSQPLTEKRVRLPFLPWLELHDLIRINPDGIHYDYAADFAVTGGEHSVDGAQGAETLPNLRGGSPVGMYHSWRRRTRLPLLGTAYSILKTRRIAETATTETWEILTGSAVDEIAIFTQPVERPYVGGTDPKETGDLSAQIVVSNGRAEHTFDKPSARYELLASLVPLDRDLDQRGGSKEILISPVPPVVSGSLTAHVSDDAADLDVTVEGNDSAFPITAEVYEDSSLSAPIATLIFAAPGTVLSSAHAGLQDRPLPRREVRSWFLKLTDVAGNEVWATPATSDRDALPWGSVTPASQRPLPYLDVTYDDDTDEVRFTVPGGKTKTFAGLSGSGIRRYTVGDALDDTTAETAFGVEEVRGTYRVEVYGGGEWLTLWEGPLEGPPAVRYTLRPVQSGSTGALTVDVHDPWSRVVDVRFKTHSGGGAVDFSDPTDGSWTIDGSIPYSAAVALSSKHASQTGWAVGYRESSGAIRYLTGVHTWDADLVAEITNLLLSFTATGNVVVSVTGDEDTVKSYVTVGIDTDPADPTASVNHGTVTGRNGSVATSIACGLGKEVRVKVVGENSAGELGPVFSGKVRRGDAKRTPRAKAEASQVTAGGIPYGVLTLTITDLTLAVTVLEYALKTGAGDFGAFTNAGWSTTSGAVGSATTLNRVKGVALQEGHNSAIKWRATYTNEDGETEQIEDVVTFDVNTVANVDSVVLDFTTAGEVVATVKGDEDTASIFVRGQVGSSPADPTDATNHGSVSARTGIISTGLFVSEGGTVYVKARGKNASGEWGPTYEVRATRPAAPAAEPFIIEARAQNTAGSTTCGSVQNTVTFAVSANGASGRGIDVHRSVDGGAWALVNPSVLALTATFVTDSLAGYRTTTAFAGADVVVAYRVAVVDSTSRAPVSPPQSAGPVVLYLETC